MGENADNGDANGNSGAEHVLQLDRGEGLIEVRLNRPEKLNALTGAMYARLTQIFTDLHERRDIRGVLLTGEGRAFCSGSDIDAMQKRDLASARARLQRRHMTIQALYRLERPVVAAVRGPVAGIGFSLAMCCDLVIASDTAYFQQSFRNVGLAPDGGAALFLTQRLGVGRAKDLVFTARKLLAAEALSWGLISQVVPDAELGDRALAVARDLAAGPTLMMAIAKKMLALASQPTLETMLEFESCAQGVARESEDHREGVEAFKQKRKPVFKGC